MKKLLTIFTPAYNRKHTISRTYESLRKQTCKDFKWLIIDDGSTDGTREWVESLGNGSWVMSQAYDWMGRCTANNSSDRHYVVEIANGDSTLHIDYIYKPNGGLYTGYNVAYDIIDTELCVCIDSDDFMPDDAVEKISNLWHLHYPKGSISSKLSIITSRYYCGIQGLDFDINTMQPIGGFFPEGLTEGCVLEHYHSGDTKQVMRTELMRQVAPQIGFEGEKNFNPIYMLINVLDRYPVLFLNENLCTVEYQVGADSMSQGIFKQYVNSPRSFAKMRLQEMSLKHNNIKDRFRSAIHYVSSCIIAKDSNWLRNSNRKLLTICAAPFGLLIHHFIMYKSRH